MDYLHRRVVITGVGLICPLGNTPESLWDGLLAGTPAVGPVESFCADLLPTSYAAEAKQFSGAIDDFGPLVNDRKKAIRKGLKLMCRETQMGVASAQRALHDAGWGAGGYEVERAGVTFGSDYMMTGPTDFLGGIKKCTEAGGFDFTKWGKMGMPEVTPLWLLKYLPNMPASHLAIYNDLRGPSNSATMREAASNLAIGEAFRTVARGAAEVMLAGATGSRVHPMKFVHALTQEQVASNGVDPAKASRPFDVHRSGQVLGEGAGAVVLEEIEYAKARGAKIYGEVLGFGSSAVADRKNVADLRQAIVNAVRAALHDSKVSAQDLGHVHAHGLSTTNSDLAEGHAIAEVLGECVNRVPVVAAKSVFGNLGAGSGAVELIASLMAMQHGKLFPALSCESPDPQCRIALVSDRDAPAGSIVLNINFTPQGQAAALVVRSC
jgi:3-oxoacyl-[acyl-carrier-protein] synthase II